MIVFLFYLLFIPSQLFPMKNSISDIITVKFCSENNNKSSISNSIQLNKAQLPLYPLLEKINEDFPEDKEINFEFNKLPYISAYNFKLWQEAMRYSDDLSDLEGRIKPFQADLLLRLILMGEYMEISPSIIEIFTQVLKRRIKYRSGLEEILNYIPQEISSGSSKKSVWSDITNSFSSLPLFNILSMKAGRGIWCCNNETEQVAFVNNAHEIVIHNGTKNSTINLKNNYPISHITFNSKGTLLAASYEKAGFIVLWNATTGKIEKKWQVKNPTCIAFNPNDKVLYNTFAQDFDSLQYISLWDIEKKVPTLKRSICVGKTGGIAGMSLSKNLFTYVTRNGDINFCHYENDMFKAFKGDSKFEKLVTLNNQSLFSPHISRNENLIATIANDNKTIEIRTQFSINHKQDSFKTILIGHTDPVIFLEFSKDGERLFSADKKEIKVWETETATCLMTMSESDLIEKSELFYKDNPWFENMSAQQKFLMHYWLQKKDNYKVPLNKELQLLKENLIAKSFQSLNKENLFPSLTAPLSEKLLNVPIKKAKINIIKQKKTIPFSSFKKENTTSNSEESLSYLKEQLNKLLEKKVDNFKVRFMSESKKIFKKPTAQKGPWFNLFN